MDFRFSDEQNMLRDSIAKFVAAQYDFDTRKAIVKSEAGRKAEYWAQYAELGLLAAPLPEAYGGLGGGASDVVVVMEEFGKGLVIDPYLQTVVLGAGAVLHAGSEAQKGEHVAAVAEGRTIIAAGLFEPKGRYNAFDVQTTAKADGAGYILNGQKAVVVGGPWADQLLISARTGGGQRERSGISLFLVPKSAAGVSTRDYPTVDGFRASEVVLENVAVGAEHSLGEPGAAAETLERILDEAAAAACAEAVGAMRMMHELTVDYARNRKQFGVAIGSFQVIQHRLVDMFMAVEQSTSLAYMAAMKLSAPAAERAKAVSAAKAQIGRAGRFVGQSAVQIHGGMGVTEEMRVGHYFKRATVIDSQFGDVDHHVKRFTALSIPEAA